MMQRRCRKQFLPLFVLAALLPSLAFAKGTDKVHDPTTSSQKILSTDILGLPPCSNVDPREIKRSYAIVIPRNLTLLKLKRHVRVFNQNYASRDITTITDIRAVSKISRKNDLRKPFDVFLKESASEVVPRSGYIKIYAITEAPQPDDLSVDFYKSDTLQSDPDATAINGFYVGKLDSGVFGKDFICRVKGLGKPVDPSFAMSVGIIINLAQWDGNPDNLKVPATFGLGFSIDELGDTPIFIDPKIRNEG